MPDFGIVDANNAGGRPRTATENNRIAQLGSVTPLLSSVFTGSTAYLQVTVNGNVMLPREQLLPAPYAHEAQLLAGERG
ncbi:MAG: hypothetical protein B7Z83_07185, partial [Thiomonas sp. 20-64-5]